MCGICGELRFDNTNISDVRKSNMLDSISDRGPDHTGRYEDKNIFLGHQRLSIIDISAKSNQPMEDEELIIVFNGVIFNYQELRTKLKEEGYKFISSGDTEVILKCYRHYGEDLVHHLDGVFSFSIFNKNSGQLFCARDRLGIKPFYYKHSSDSFSFASNTKALINKTENLPVNNESFITASTGRKILYFESDATNSDDPMALDDSYTDLTLDHASQGQRVIEAKYKQSQEVSMHRVFRVFLGNTSIFNKTGSGKKITVRQRIEKTHEMDVVIDARAAVFTDLLRWCARVTKDRKKREIILSTSATAPSRHRALKYIRRRRCHSFWNCC